MFKHIMNHAGEIKSVYIEIRDVSVNDYLYIDGVLYIVVNSTRVGEDSVLFVKSLGDNLYKGESI